MTRLTLSPDVLALNPELETHAEMSPGGSERSQERRKGAKSSNAPRRRGANPESDLQTAIANALRLHGCYVERRNSGAVRTQAGGLVRLAPVGTPDLFALAPPRRAGAHATPVYVEVKRPGQAPTPAQAERHAELRGYGAVVIVAHSVDEALELLEVYL